LSVPEAMAEAEVLRQRGMRHILVVAGDYPSLTTTEYFTSVLSSLAAEGDRPSIEIAPQSTDSYAAMAAAGACGITLYQETYDEALYAAYHPRGSKTSYDWRLEGVERAAESGMKRLGLGVLLGLADPRADLLALVRHGRYLRARFPDRTLAFSLPRIHRAPDDFTIPHPVDDPTFVHLYCALRMAFPDAELVLSTREGPELRNRLAAACVTQLSAGSSTAPGGYQAQTANEACDAQFPVCDHRSVEEVRAWLEKAGLQPVYDPGVYND
jgi:2-iminoacetate synthase